MSNKLTFEEVEKIIFDKTHAKCKLINFISTHDDMEIKCKCEKNFTVLMGNFKKGKIFCNECLENIRKQKQFIKMVNFIHSCGNYVLSKCHEYIDDKSSFKILCKCGNVFETTYRRYKHRNKRQCNDCGYATLTYNKHDISDVYDLFKSKGLIPIFNENDYKDSNTRLPFKCSIHIDQDIQHISYSSLVRDFAIGCTYCRNEKLREEFKIKNPRDFFVEKGFIPLFKNDEYMNSSQQLPFICKTHEEYGEQETSLNNVRHKKGCQYCFDSRSKGELKIQEYLDKLSMIQYKMEEGFSDCKYKIMLKFDFLIYQNNEIKLIVEYDGIQHFEPVDFAGKGEEWAINTFQETQLKDSIKNRYCLERKIPLIRIPYWEFDSISYILENVFRYLNIIELDCNKNFVFKYFVDENWENIKSVI